VKQRKTPKTLRPLWQCPKCGKRFVTKNIWHSCRRYSFEPLFAKCDPHVIEMYRKFEAMVKRCGPVFIEPRKINIAFYTRVRAIGCTPHKTYIRIGFAFRRLHKHPRFVKTTSFSKSFHAHWIDVHSLTELDNEVRQWIRDAYKVSSQRKG
jgi:hypothetical protein